MDSWAKNCGIGVDALRGKASATSANESPVSKCDCNSLDARAACPSPSGTCPQSSRGAGIQGLFSFLSIEGVGSIQTNSFVECR